jgi:peptide/nickel transport system substrate-binding protein
VAKPQRLLHTWDKDGGGTFNAGRYSNPRLDALIDAVRTERDPARNAARSCPPR